MALSSVILDTAGGFCLSLAWISVVQLRLPEINMEPENAPLEDENHLPKRHFRFYGCHFVRWCLSLGIAGGIATFDEILWPTLSRWNCQTCLTHFYDSTRYFLVPTKKAVSLKSLHSQLVACCISIFHHKNTRPDALSINIYPDDPRCSMFACICLHLSARQPPKCMEK